MKLTDFDPDMFGDQNVCMLFDNPAEMAYASSMLLASFIDHGFTNDDRIKLFLIDNYSKSIQADLTIISSLCLNAGCKPSNVTGWEALSQNKNIVKLVIAGREFYEYTSQQIHRWCCRNMYDITHICIDKSDIGTLDLVCDGIFDVTIIPDGKKYCIVSKHGDFIGEMSIEFFELMKELIEESEIPEQPALINGIQIVRKQNRISVLGMGHLKFTSY